MPGTKEARPRPANDPTASPNLPPTVSSEPRSGAKYSLAEPAVSRIDSRTPSSASSVSIEAPPNAACSANPIIPLGIPLPNSSIWSRKSGSGSSGSGAWLITATSCSKVAPSGPSISYTLPLGASTSYIGMKRPSYLTPFSLKPLVSVLAAAAGSGMSTPRFSPNSAIIASSGANDAAKPVIAELTTSFLYSSGVPS